MRPWTANRSHTDPIAFCFGQLPRSCGRHERQNAAGKQIALNTRKVVHHITASWRPEWNGTSQTRFFTSEGNKLTIKTAPQKATVAAGETVSTLTFDQVVLQNARGSDVCYGSWPCENVG